MCKFFKIFLFTLFLLIVGSFFSVQKANAAVLNMTGFETGDVLEGEGNSTGTIQSSIKRTGAYALQANLNYEFDPVPMSDGRSNTYANPVLTTGYLTSYMYLAAGVGVETGVIYIGYQAAGGAKINVNLQTDNTLKLYYNNGSDAQTLIGSASPALNTSQWYRIEVRIGSGTNATIEGKIDGTAWATGTGLTTGSNSARRAYQTIRFTGGADVYFDDVGIDNAGYLGAGQVDILKPNATGSTSTWANGAGTSPTNLATVPNDGDTGYITSSTANDVTTVNFDNVSGNIGGTIGGIKAGVVLRDVPNGTGDTSVRILSNGVTRDTDVSGAGNELSSTYGWRQLVLATDPNTGAAWTTSGIDAVEAGVLNTVNVETRATSIYTMVWDTGVAVPTISSPTKTPIHGSDATLGGNVTSDGGATVSGRGVCIGASSNPALGGTCFSTSGTTGVFTVSATSLTQGTLYHYRAYATNSVGTSYTTDDTFTTLALNNYLVTVVSPQTAAVCATGTNSVTARDSTNTTITTDSSTVNMTNSGTSVTFYTTSGCTVSTTQYTLSSGVANIYYKTNVAQSFTITATKNGSTETGTSSSVTVNPGSQTRLVVTLPGQTFTATSGNSGSTTNQKVDSQFTITSLTATDDYFNVVTSYSGAKTLAYSGPTVTGGTFYTTSVNFTSGVSTTTLYTILTKAETKTITVTDGGQYGYASSNLTVTASSAPKLNIKGGVHF